MTGFNPNFNQMSTPPPVPPLPPSLNGNNNVNSTAPANVFAQMKAGTFGKDDAPQPSGSCTIFPGNWTILTFYNSEIRRPETTTHGVGYLPERLFGTILLI